MLLGFSSFFSVIPTGMADFFFRAAVWRVGHGAGYHGNTSARARPVKLKKSFLAS